MIIRPAALNDTDRIAELYQQLFTLMADYQPDRWRPAQQDRGFIENAVTDEKFCLLVAETEGHIAGFAFAQTQVTSPYTCIPVWCRVVSVISLILWLIRRYADRAPEKNYWMLLKTGQRHRAIRIWSCQCCRKTPVPCVYMSAKAISR